MRVTPVAPSAHWDVDKTRIAFRKVRDAIVTLDGHVSAAPRGALTMERFDACAKQIRTLAAQVGGDATLNTLCASVPAQASEHINQCLDQMRLQLLAPSESRLEKVAAARKGALDAVDTMEAILSRVAERSKPEQGGALSSSMGRVSLDSRRPPARTSRTAEDVITPIASPAFARPPSTPPAATVRAARATVNGRVSSSAPLLHSLVAAGDVAALAESATLLEVDWLDQHGRTPLHVAAALGSLACVQVLIRAGANVNLLDGLQCTPLLVAASKGHWDVCEALLDAAADPTISGGGGVQAQPVDYLYDVNPASADELRMLGLFFDCGVDTNHQMKYGDTFLHVAAKHNNLALARMLLARPTVSVDALNRKDERPIDKAVGHAEMTRILMMKGAKRSLNSPPPVRK